MTLELGHPRQRCLLTLSLVGDCWKLSIWPFLTPPAIQQESPGFKRKRAENQVWSWWSLTACRLLLWTLFAPYLDMTGNSEAMGSSESGTDEVTSVVSRKDPESLPNRLPPGTWASTKCESRYQKLYPDQGPLKKELSGCSPLPVERKTVVFLTAHVKAEVWTDRTV